MADWEPPVIAYDYGNKARVATQADIDRWLLIEQRYNELLRTIRVELIPQIERADGKG